MDFAYTNERDVISSGCGIGDAGAHGNHDEEQGDEETDPVVALLSLDVERGKGAEGKEAQRDVVHQKIREVNAKK